MRRADPAECAGSGAAPPALPEDGEALGALLRRLEPRMLAVARRFVRDGDAAWDVVQNAWEKVWRHREAFRGDARASTWIHRIVANEALMWLRAEGRRAQGRLDEGPATGTRLADPAPSAETRLLRRERAEALRRALETLPPDDRDLLDHCALGDVSYRRYGRERGLHPAAVKSRAFRARRRLADHLDVA